MVPGTSIRAHDLAAGVTKTTSVVYTVADSATGPNADLLLNDVDIDSDDLTITEVGGDTASVGKATAGSGGGSFTTVTVPMVPGTSIRARPLTIWQRV